MHILSFSDEIKNTFHHFERVFSSKKLSQNWDCTFKDTLKAFDEFNNKQKSVWSKAFWCLKLCKCVYSESVIFCDKTQTLKKFSSNKISVTKNALFLLSWAPTHHSFAFNLRFLYELKHKVHLSKTVGFSIFNSVLLLLSSTKWMNSLTLKRHNSFQN